MEAFIIIVVFVLMLMFIWFLYDDNAKLRRQLNTDYLTNLANREYAETIMLARLSVRDRRRSSEQIHDTEQRKAQRREVDETAFWFLLMDVDNFKDINDQAGHSMGDLVLQNIAAVMEEEFTDSICARWAGDEFACIVGPDQDVCEQKIQKFFEKISSLSFVLGETKKVNISLSIGIAKASRSGDPEKDSSNVYERADKALYEAKETRGNKCIFA